MNNKDQEVDIKIVRLVTGEDIVCVCDQEDEDGFLTILNPMRFFMRKSVETGQTMLIMTPWLPLEIIKENSTTINFGDIIAMVEPKDNFKEYYLNLANQYQELSDIQGDNMFNLEEEGMQNDEEEELTDEYLQEMMESMRESKDKLLH